MRKYIDVIQNFFKNGKFIHISFLRGLAIIPARFIVEIEVENKAFHLEAETNFRILHKGENILSFDDLYCTHEFKEITEEEYLSQLTIEKTYLSKGLEKVNKKFHGSTISSLKFSKSGDVTIYLEKNKKISFINDTHIDNYVILKILLKEENEDLLHVPHPICKYVIKNGRPYMEVDDRFFSIFNGVNAVE